MMQCRPFVMFLIKTFSLTLLCTPSHDPLHQYNPHTPLSISMINSISTQELIYIHVYSLNIFEFLILWFLALTKSALFIMLSHMFLSRERMQIATQQMKY